MRDLSCTFLCLLQFIVQSLDFLGFILIYNDSINSDLRFM